MSVDKKELFLNRTAHALRLTITEVEEIFSSDKLSSIRLNTLKVASAESVLKSIRDLVNLKEISWCPNSYWNEGQKDVISKSTYFAEGLLTIQNASSLIPPLALGFSDNAEILDTCSSPGVKAAHIAGITGNRGSLTVNEPDRRRATSLGKNLNQLGVNYRLLNIPAQFLNHRLASKFDYILVDAPCSGEGMIDLRKKDPLNFWNLKKVNALSKLQKRIVLSVLKLLKPGGTLVYSTCTISPEENEGVIDYVLSGNPDLTVEEINIPVENRMASILEWQGHSYDPEISKALRIKPDKYMEAFFVCRMKKN